MSPRNRNRIFRPSRGTHPRRVASGQSPIAMPRVAPAPKSSEPTRFWSFVAILRTHAFLEFHFQELCWQMVLGFGCSRSFKCHAWHGFGCSRSFKCPQGEGEREREWMRAKAPGGAGQTVPIFKCLNDSDNGKGNGRCR